VKPAGIETMFVPHAKNYMDKEPALPKPVYAPELAARSILYAAQHPKRDVFVGGAAKALSASNATMPGLLERYLRTTMFKQQQSKSSSRQTARMRCTRRTRTRKCASARTSPSTGHRKLRLHQRRPALRTRSCRCWSAARPCSAPGSWRAAPAACARHPDAPSR
jgi:hypothetical protein